MKEINNIVEWLIQSGALVALFSFAWKYVKPWLDTKQTHAQTEQAKVAWGLLEQVADTSVAALVSQNMTGKDKFNLARISLTWQLRMFSKQCKAMGLKLIKRQQKMRCNLLMNRVH